MRSQTNSRFDAFVAPTLISDELAIFLDKPLGTVISRETVSRAINTYIRVNGLQDPTNSRKINPDENLRNLLRLNTGAELTYFNIAKYMKHHYIN
jgi:chromatin remodeling complex protein RSC6